MAGGLVDVPADVPAQAEAVVLGAGISGLVSASVLQAQGTSRVAVVDSYPAAGGNHLDTTIGPYTFDVGSLVFQDDSPLLAHFPELLERYVPIEPSWSRLTPRGTVSAYPFSVRDDLLATGPVEVARTLGSTAAARLRRGQPRSAREFADRWLGPRLVERSGLSTYMERFCGLPAEQIDVEFAHHRMMWIAENARASAVAAGLASKAAAAARRRFTSRQDPPGNQQLARPREGFAHLYEPALERLTAAGATVVLGAALQSVRRDGEAFVLTTDRGEVRAPRLVSTVPVDVALDLCGLRGDEPPLPSVTLLSLYLSFSGERGYDSSVLYNFSHEGGWKRLTTYSDFYGRAQDQHEDREYVGVEVVSGTAVPSSEEAFAAFRQHTRQNGLFRGDLRLEGSSVLEHAYPLYTRGSAERARDARRRLRAFGVESLGRQGAFDYHPTARQSTLEAEAALGLQLGQQREQPGQRA